MLAPIIARVRAGTASSTARVAAAQDPVEAFIGQLVTCLDAVEPALEGALDGGREVAREALDARAGCLAETSAAATEAHDTLSRARNGFEADLRDVRAEEARQAAVAEAAAREIVRLEAEVDELQRRIDRQKWFLLLGAIGLIPLLVRQSELSETLDVVRQTEAAARSARAAATQRLVELEALGRTLEDELRLVLDGGDLVALLRSNVDQVRGFLDAPAPNEAERATLGAALRQIGDLRLIAGQADPAAVAMAG